MKDQRRSKRINKKEEEEEEDQPLSSCRRSLIVTIDGSDYCFFNSKILGFTSSFI